MNKNETLAKIVKVPLNHPLFYPRLFSLAARVTHHEQSKDGNPLTALASETYDELSRHMDRSLIQESCSLRNVRRSLKIATALIDDSGEIDLSLIPQLLSALKAHLYSLGPNRGVDKTREEHFIYVLTALQQERSIVLLLKKMSRPLSNSLAESLIRQTVQLSAKTPLTDAHVRRAALSAWLCTLRQNVGSCFATAPAEIVQREQPQQFLQDLLDIIATGRLKRTKGGIENSVPLSVSWGSGDLKKPLLLRLSSKKVSPEIWYSPGLLAAFDAIGFFGEEATAQYKVETLQEWVMALIDSKHTQVYCLTTAEEVIEFVLLRALELDSSQLKDYEMRPKTMMPTTLVDHPMQTRLKKEKGSDKCQQFFALFEAATSRFKAFADNPLLKAWEYTLASFAESKYEFTEWNLYASLGMRTDEAGGIGECIRNTVQHKIDLCNQQILETQDEYDILFTQLKTLEARIRQASTEKELQWLRFDYHSRRNEFYLLEEQREGHRERAKALVNLYEVLYNQYINLFKDYFQEVYDADMQEVRGNPFDDSPAGFRLVYKYGRSNTAQWTRVKNHREYIDSLSSFFVATEPQIASILDGKKIERDLSDIVTAIISHIKTKEFIETAFHRMATAHGLSPIRNPLEHLDKIEKKPWVYTSGGKMDTLVAGYFRLDDEPVEAKKWIESEMELLVFLADTLKLIPHSLMKDFVGGMRTSLLMQSPTHAFLLQPMRAPFLNMWSNDAFTYTYIRDAFLHPCENFVRQLLLDDEMIHYLVEKVSEKVPENYLPRFRKLCGSLRGPLSPLFFREALLDFLETDSGLKFHKKSVLSIEEIDSQLYSSLPLFHVHELRGRVEKIVTHLHSVSPTLPEECMRTFDSLSLSTSLTPVLGAKELLDICKAILIAHTMKTSSSCDFPALMLAAARECGYAMRAPLIFADTNWVKDYFGFVVSPGTGKLELWRMSDDGTSGYPMSSWKQWLDGSHKEARWSVYTRPYQYGQ